MKSDPNRLRQRLQPLAKSLTLIGKGQLGPRVSHGFGDAPCDRTVIGDAHDQAALALQNSGHVRYPLYLLKTIDPVGAAKAEAVGHHRIEPGVFHQRGGDFAFVDAFGEGFDVDRGV